MIQLSYNIKKYREQLLNTIENGDIIIELGCHIGNSTRLMLETFNDCQIIALDNSPEAIDKMQELEDEYDNLTFISGDVRLHDKIAEVFKLIQKCDILSVDLGGGYHPDTTFKVFYIWSSTFKPSNTLIRNKGLIDFVNTVEPLNEEFISKNGFLESYHDEGIPPQIKEFELWTPSIRNR